MIYIVYEQWDEAGPSPVAVEELANKNAASSFINRLDMQKSANGIKYRINLIVEGNQLSAVKAQSYAFFPHKEDEKES